MPYQLLGHTADLRLQVSGKNQEELFGDALAGLTAVLKPEQLSDVPRPTTGRVVALTAPDRTTLLVDFLNEALALANINKEIYSGVNFKNLKDTALEAELIGQPVSEFAEDIKAVTYHQAEIKERDGRLETTLIFDL